MLYQRFTRTEPEDAQSIDLTPMLDVVFILLIFFIVTTSFIKTSGIEVDRPTAASAKKIDVEPLRVVVREDATFYIDDKIQTLSALTDFFKKEVSQNVSVSLIIDSDKNVQIGDVVILMDIAKQAGINSIAIGANETR